MRTYSESLKPIQETHRCSIISQKNFLFCFMKKSSTDPKGTPRPTGGLIKLQSPSDRITHAGAIEISRSDSPPKLRYRLIGVCAVETKKKATSDLYLDRRLGVYSDREISKAPACVILSLGLWSSISPPGLGLGLGLGRALGGWCLTFWGNESKSCSASS